MFTFEGNYRWQLFLATPNACAILFALGVFFSLGLFFRFYNRRDPSFIFLTALLAGAIILQEIIIVMTYSRGGLVALCVGLSFAAWFAPRKWLIFFIVILATLIIVLPSGISRVISAGNFSDGSIYHRILLWQGGCGIIAENWLFGFGDHLKAGLLYTAWNQPLWLNETYHHFINDYLTLAASYGLPALGVYIFLLGLIFLDGVRVYRKNRDPFLLYLLAAIICYCVGSIFSTFYIYKSILVVWIGILVMTMVCIIRKNGFRFGVVSVKAALILAFLLPAAIWAYGYDYNSRRGFNIETLNDGALIATPLRSVNAAIVYVYDKKIATEHIARTVVRPLVGAGFRVVTCPIIPDIRAVAILRKKLAGLAESTGNDKYWLLGQNEAAMVAIAAMVNNPCDLEGIITIDMPETWPIKELNAEINQNSVPVPIWRISGSPTMTIATDIAIKTISEFNHNKTDHGVER